LRSSRDLRPSAVHPLVGALTRGLGSAELDLLAALGGAPPAREPGPAAGPRAVALARSLGVAPYVHWRAASGLASVSPRLADEIAGALETDFDRATERNRRRLARLAECLGALAGRVRPPVVLKGADLAVNAYPHVGLRTMADVDLLLEREELADAGAALARSGLREVAEGWTRSPRAPRYHLAPLVCPATGLVIELHWALWDERFAFPGLCLPAADALAAAVPGRIFGAPCRFLGAAHRIGYHCFHLAVWHAFELGLRGLVDLAWLRARGAPAAAELDRGLRGTGLAPIAGACLDAATRLLGPGDAPLSLRLERRRVSPLARWLAPIFRARLWGRPLPAPLAGFPGWRHLAALDWAPGDAARLRFLLRLPGLLRDEGERGAAGRLR
jgi:hypothetical protein